MLNKLIKYFIEENSKINLSAIRNYEDIKLKHVQDSLKLFEFFSFPSNSQIADVWTGSGFPLLPLAIYSKKCKFVWIESVNKKVKAINRIIKKLQLNNVKVLWSRAENYTQQQFDFVTARAVAYADKLIKYTYHLVKKKGYFIFYKIFSEEEYDTLIKVCNQKKLIIEDRFFYKLFEQDIQRVIYLIRKL